MRAVTSTNSLKPGLAQLQRGRRRDHAGIDAPLRERGDDVGHALQVSYLHILAGRHAGLLKENLRGEIGSRSRQGNAHDFSAQIAELFEIRLAINREHRAIENTDDESDLLAAESGFDDFRGGIDDIDAAGK